MPERSDFDYLTMDPHQIESLFNDALDLPVDKRAEYIASASGSNSELAQEVESLLASHQHVGAFLDAPAPPISVVDIAEEILESHEVSAVGKLVGPYKIEKEIGTGGMGSVFLAKRNDLVYHKSVAIKLLRGGNGNESIVRRFEKERQILADLEHPNIARLIDGGVTEGNLPYFVMEYVEGTTISHFCKANELSIGERLVLFRKVCEAVAFAHNHSIIHRDIKPSNILVTDDGIPKLLDFGIAKTLSLEDTLTALPLMTPEYASPEQMRGEVIGKASDVYSLGVLLYKLVTGSTPYTLTNKSPYEIVQAVCEEEPLPPSGKWIRRNDNLKRGDERSIPFHLELGVRGTRLKKNIDIIVAKALAKDPAQRYLSVEEFSEDVRRCIEGQPVLGKSSGKRLNHRSHNTVVLAAFGSLAVLLSIAIYLFYFDQPNLLRSSNEANFSDLLVHRVIANDGGTDNNEAHNFYVRGYHLWSQRSAETNVQAAGLFRQAIAKDPEFALAYAALANSYTLSHVWSSLPPAGGVSEARRAAEKAIELEPVLSEGHLSLAMVLWLFEWDWQGADRSFRQAIDFNPNYTLAPHWYGLFLAEMGRFDEAIAAEKRALEIEPLSVPINSDLARVLFYARHYDESLEQYRKTLALNPNYLGCQGELLEFYETVGMLPEWYELIKRNEPMSPELKRAYEIGGIAGYRRLAYRLSTNRAWDYYFSPVHRDNRFPEKDEAFRLLNEEFEKRRPRMVQLKVHPKFDHLRDDPRFAQLLERMNLND